MHLRQSDVLLFTLFFIFFGAHASVFSVVPFFRLVSFIRSCEKRYTIRRCSGLGVACCSCYFFGYNFLRFFSTLFSGWQRHFVCKFHWFFTHCVFRNRKIEKMNWTASEEFIYNTHRQTFKCMQRERTKNGI